MKTFSLILALAGFLFAPIVLADGQAYSWLQRMNQASRSVSYTGVFVYESKGRTETSRVFRLVDASGEHERLESLDGPPREVVRNNEEVQCFLPQERVVVVDRSVQGRRSGRLLVQPAILAEYYSIRLGEQEPVAGRPAQQIYLEPRDGMRYGHQFWIDVASGLLVRAKMLNEQADEIEQFSFSDLSVGAGFDHESMRPRLSKGGGWEIINARGVEIRGEDLDWLFRKLPSGFKAVSLVKRLMRKDRASTIHAVFSDGLASVSVFIEPARAGMPPLSDNGAQATGTTGVYRRIQGDSVLTIMGEVPLSALKRIAEGIEPRRRLSSRTE